jgi:hypothetical protein
MSIVGEQVIPYYHDAQGALSATYEFGLPGPRNVMAKVALNRYIEYATSAGQFHSAHFGQHAEISIENIIRIRQDGIIERVNIKSSFAYDPKMLGITIKLYGKDALLSGLLIIEYWG